MGRRPVGEFTTNLNVDEREIASITNRVEENNGAMNGQVVTRRP
jgi:hypothetical protein